MKLTTSAVLAGKTTESSNKLYGQQYGSNNKDPAGKNTSYRDYLMVHDGITAGKTNFHVLDVYMKWGRGSEHHVVDYCLVYALNGRTCSARFNGWQKTVKMREKNARVTGRLYSRQPVSGRHSGGRTPLEHSTRGARLGQLL